MAGSSAAASATEKCDELSFDRGGDKEVHCGSHPRLDETHRCREKLAAFALLRMRVRHISTLQKLFTTALSPVRQEGGGMRPNEYGLT